MTAAITFDLTAAQEALARSNDGEKPLPGDQALIDAYEGFCQQEQDRYEYAEYQARLAEWLATQCPDCEDDATGELCDHHAEEVGE